MSTPNRKNTVVGKKKPLHWVWRILTLAGMVYLGFCLLLAGMYAFPGRSTPPPPSGFKEFAIQGPSYPVWVIGSPGWEKSERVVIFAHGVGGTATSWGPIMEPLGEKGVASLGIHMAGHGRSARRAAGFGPPERDEIVATVKHVRKTNGIETQIVLAGVSMGAGACWMAAGQIPTEIEGVYSESPFADFSKVVDANLDQMVPAGSRVLRPVVWFTRLLTGTSPGDTKPGDAAAPFAGRPAIIAYSTADTIIPPAESERMIAITGAKPWKFEGHEHASMSWEDPNETVRRILSLFPAR